MDHQSRRKEIVFFGLLILCCFIIPVCLVIRRYSPLSANTADELASVILRERHETIRRELHSRFQGGSAHVSDDRDPRDDPEYQWGQFRTAIIESGLESVEATDVMAPAREQFKNDWPVLTERCYVARQPVWVFVGGNTKIIVISEAVPHKVLTVNIASPMSVSGWTGGGGGDLQNGLSGGDG